MRPDNFNTNKLIESLQGTCMSIDDAISQEYTKAYDEGLDESSLTIEESQQIDMEIFNCETCGWWFERCEESETEEGHCDTCENEEDEDE